MSDPATILLYAFSTLAQTCAALAAFIGAVWLYHMSLLKEERNDLFRSMRAKLGNPSETYDSTLIQIQQSTDPEIRVLRNRRSALPQQISSSTKRLVIFEACQLFVILCALVGLPFVKGLGKWPCASTILLVVLALGAVATTAYCVWIWSGYKRC